MAGRELTWEHIRVESLAVMQADAPPWLTTLHRKLLSSFIQIISSCQATVACRQQYPPPNKAIDFQTAFTACNLLACLMFVRLLQALQFGELKLVFKMPFQG